MAGVAAARWHAGAVRASDATGTGALRALADACVAQSPPLRVKSSNFFRLVGHESPEFEKISDFVVPRHSGLDGLSWRRQRDARSRVAVSHLF